MDVVNKDIVKKILSSISMVMEENKELLIALDGAMGDGDLGLTMCAGFHAVEEELAGLAEEDLGKVIMKLGMKMNAVVPSTMGTLISTCFIKAAPVAKGKTELLLSDLAKMARAAADGVMQRGKSQPGDKTMLDALVPATEALEHASAAGQTIKEAQKAAFEAARDGVEKTKTMQSVHGRAAYYAEKSVGRQDPGATAVMFIFEGIYKAME